MLTIWRILHRLGGDYKDGMQRVLVLSFYVLSLLVDAVRAFALSFAMFSSQAVLPPYSYVVLSFFSLSPVLWFSLIIADEKDGSTLKMLSLIKIFSVFSAFLFFVEGMKDSSVVSDAENLTLYSLLFVCIDFLMLSFAFFRRRVLCK